jgi:tetratricopeptide (TPR) repeat protein
MKRKDTNAEAMPSILQPDEHHLTGTFVHVALIAVLGVLAYSNTLQVPFQWDEDIFIKGSPVVKDLGYFVDPERAKGLELHGALRSRYIGYLTFALNYSIGGLDVTGYHLFNIAVHILNALLVYALVLCTFQTPFLRGGVLYARAYPIALLSSLLFVSHPIQTEAVTYIFQRLASLAAFFSLLSLLAYVRSRQSASRASAIGFYAVSVVSAVLAMKTKENAFTLPLVIVLFEFLFFTGRFQRRALALLPLLLTLAIIPLTLAGTDKPVGDVISDIVPATRGYDGLSRGVYLITEFRVIVTYLRLLALPIDQNFDYDYPVFRSFSDPQVLSSFLLLLSIALLALYLLRRSRTGERDAAVVAFGIFWFFITLSVESSIVPIPMLINEYRLYLPSVGAFLAFSTGAFLLLETLRSRRARSITRVALFTLPFVLSIATYQRNALWETRVSLWEDVVRKSPSLVYPRNNLGIAYVQAGRVDEAVRQFQAALAIKPDHDTAHNNLGVIYAQRGRWDEAMQAFQAALRYNPDIVDAHNNIGLLYLEKGLYAEAERAFRSAMRMDPVYAKAHYNLGVLFERQGRVEEAAREFQKALRLDPSYTKARIGLQELSRRQH